MIVDRFDHWSDYFPGGALTPAHAFLSSLAPDIAEGEYPLSGEDIFARVMSYETREPGACVLEAHREYVDVQAVIRGAEGIAWFPREGLAVKVPYDASRDVEFYHPDGPGTARIVVTPGIFVALFPWDAHMPQLSVLGIPEQVKKVVVKIRRGLFSADGCGCQTPFRGTEAAS